MKRKRDAQIVWLHLNEEVPRLGSGRRRVAVERLGWKWVRARHPHFLEGPVIKVRRAVWDQLVVTGWGEC